MILKGIVSSIETDGTRVTFPEKENAVSPPLQKVSCVNTLEVGNKVIVILFSDNMKDGLILAEY